MSSEVGLLPCCCLGGCWILAKVCDCDSVTPDGTCLAVPCSWLEGTFDIRYFPHPDIEGSCWYVDPVDPSVTVLPPDCLEWEPLPIFESCLDCCGDCVYKLVPCEVPPICDPDGSQELFLACDTYDQAVIDNNGCDVFTLTSSEMDFEGCWYVETPPVTCPPSGTCIDAQLTCFDDCEDCCLCQNCGTTHRQVCCEPYPVLNALIQISAYQPDLQCLGGSNPCSICPKDFLLTLVQEPTGTCTWYGPSGSPHPCGCPPGFEVYTKVSSLNTNCPCPFVIQEGGSFSRARLECGGLGNTWVFTWPFDLTRVQGAPCGGPVLPCCDDGPTANLIAVSNTPPPNCDCPQGTYTIQPGGVIAGGQVIIG
jgi:hypothetical protein